MFSPDTTSYPPPFVPPPGPSGSKSGAWLFTRPWKLRRHLAQAYQTPEDAQAIEALEESYKHLADSGEIAAINDSTIEEALLLIVWAKLRQQSLVEAKSWLEELDKQKPNLPEGGALRWQLMRRLLEEGDVDAYLAQCRLFLANPSTDFRKYKASVLEAISAVYEKASPNDCAEVISAAHPALRRNEIVQACLDLSRCPNVFNSVKDARLWASKIDPEVFTFSSFMRSDALLVRVRAAEVEDDLRSMYLYSVAAIVEKPDHLPARYWMVRTKLYASDADPTAGLDLGAAPDTGNWQRLTRLARLCSQPTLENAAEFVPLLVDDENPLDLSEQRLTIRLLKNALTISPTWSAEKIAQCYELCDKIERAVGRQPWTQLNIAIQEIRWEGRYASAVARLEKDDVIKEPGAPTLARIARILAGAPELTSGRSDQPCLLALETAMGRLLSFSSRDALHDDHDISVRLEEAREDHLCEEFPALAEVADVLRFAAGVLLRGEAAQSLNPISSLAPTAPLWLIWLNARARIIQVMSAGQTTLPDTLDRTNGIIAWDAQRWERVYDNPSSEIHQMTPLPQNLNDLGELCWSLCKTENSFEKDYFEARQKLRIAGLGKGCFEDAMRPLQRIADALDTLALPSRAWWQPEILYLLGVAKARLDPQRSKAILESVLVGPKSFATRAQLALLAIKERDLDAAERWVADETDKHPAIMYAQSLLLARRGRNEEACGLLDRFENAFGLTPSPYALACRRLRAAIAERSGDAEQAETLHRATLAAFPSDPTASARLGRMLFERAYQNSGANSFPADEELGTLLKDASEKTSAPVAWSGSLLSLYQLLIAPETEIETQIAKFQDSRSSQSTPGAMSQVLIRRLLELRRSWAALEVLEKSSGSAGSRRLQRTRLILNGWRNLNSLWMTYQPPDAQVVEAEVARIRAERIPDLDGEAMWRLADERMRQQALGAAISQEALKAISSCLKEIEAFGNDETDEALRRWRFLLARASELNDGNEIDLKPELWAQLDPWAIGALPELFAQEESERIRSAQALEQRLSKQEGLATEQRRLLDAISSYETRREDAFLDAFGELELVLDLLPIDAASMWLAASDIRFRRKMWAPIIEGALPESIADLSNPQVRLVVSFAHIRSAIDDIWKDGVRDAQRKVRQARNMLAPLLGGETDAD